MTTYKQMKFYRAEWAKAKVAIEQLHGELLSKDEENDERKHCHTIVGAVYKNNEPKSSKDLTSTEFDRVLSVFFSWSHSASLEHQGRQLDQPFKRCRYVVDDLLDRIQALLEVQNRPKQTEAIKEGKAREGYILFMLRRLARRPESSLSDVYPLTTWYDLITALQIRHDQVIRQANGKGRRTKRTRAFDGPRDMSQCRINRVSLMTEGFGKEHQSVMSLEEPY